MLNVGIIGCGNAGNQVCALCATRYPDIPVIAINCSENDMQSLPASVTKFLIGDGRGAGKNREEAKEFLEGSIMEFVSDASVRDMLKDLDIVYIVSSTGGGTGSGISVLLANVIKSVCADAEQPVLPILVGILPTLKEALATQANTLSYLNELYVLTDDPVYMLYDNEKYAKESTINMMEKINSAIVEDINVMRGFYNVNTVFSSIDEKDAFTILASPGRLVITRVEDIKEKDLDEDTDIEDLLVNEIKRGPHTELQLDGIVNRIGVITNLSKNLIDNFDTTVAKVRNLVGDPVEQFEHIGVNDDRKDTNRVMLIIAGLTKVNDRIAKINDRIDEINEVQKKKEDDSELDMDRLRSVQQKRTYRKNVENAGNVFKVDLSSIFNKFKS